MRLEILVEEESMKVLLEELVPRIIDSDAWKLNENVFIRAFEGKSHLKKELPTKARVYATFHEPVYLLVLQDQDSSDCLVLKEGLSKIIDEQGLEHFKVRIVCQELECWYLGDLPAVEAAHPETQATRFQNKSKFRNPEKLNGKDELKKWISPYSAVGFARTIAPFMSLESNKAGSFLQTVAALKHFLS